MQQHSGPRHNMHMKADGKTQRAPYEQRKWLGRPQGNARNMDMVYTKIKQETKLQVINHSRLLLSAWIWSSERHAIQRHRSITPWTGSSVYLLLASIRRSRHLTILAAVRYRSKLTSASPSRVPATCEGFCALYVRSWT